MMNRELVEAFQRVHADGATGTIAARSGERSLRFYFEQGELMMLDYGEDKERALLRQYRAYHKIGPEIEAICSQMIANGTKVKDFLLNQQLVTHEEVAQVTRSLVEDTLCDWFETPSEEVRWDDAAGADSYDLATRAVKLRIQIEVLLEMLAERVAEREAVRSHVSDYHQVYGLTEDAPPSDRLNEMERNLLQVIDGRRSVHEIAQAVRDSDLNTATYLTSLLKQGYIRPQRRETGTLSGKHAVTPAASADDSGPVDLGAMGSATGAAADDQRQSSVIEGFEVTVRERPRGSRAPVLILLLAVLAAVAWVGWLYLETQRREAVIDDLRDQISAHIDARDWVAADRSIGEAREQAGADVVLVERLDEFIERSNQRFADQLDRFEAALEEDRLAAAADVDRELPAAPGSLTALWEPALAERLAELRERHRVRQEEIAEEARLFRRSIETLLDGGNLTVARERIAGKQGQVAAAGRAALDDWRARLLREADDPARSLGERERRLAHAEEADPTADQAAIIRELHAQLRVERARLGERIDELATAVATGALARAAELGAQLEREVAGSDLSPRVAALNQTRAELAERLNRLEQEAAAAIGDHDRRQGFSALAEGLVAMREQLPAYDRSAEFLALAQALTRIAEANGRETLAGELAVLAEIPRQGLPEAAALALEDRQEALATLTARAESELAHAQALAERGDYDAAERAYRAIMERPAYGRTPAVAAARAGLQAVAEARRRREARLAALRSAMLAEDLDAVTRLANELALPRLPILITSHPAGATIRRDGQEVGTTPWLEEDLSSERLQASYRLELPGYRPRVVEAASAAGGWRIAVELERAPSAVQQLSHNVTNTPAAVHGALWLVGSRHVARVTPASAESRPFGASVATTRPLRHPAYAAAVADGDDAVIATRDRLVLRIGAEEITREPMAVATDRAIALHHSQVVIDRVLAIAATRDGEVVASNLSDGSAAWRVPGSPVAAAPLLTPAGVLVLRQDGAWQLLGTDTGQELAAGSLASEVVAAWPEGDALVAVAGRERYRWTDRQGPRSEASYPNRVLSAGPGCVITRDRRVHRHGPDGELVHLGVLPPEVTLAALPLVWNDHVVVAFGRQAVVYGPHGFSVNAESDVLAPAVLDGDLAIVEVEGRVRWYAGDEN